MHETGEIFYYLHNGITLLTLELHHAFMVTFSCINFFSVQLFIEIEFFLYFIVTVTLEKNPQI